MAALCAQFGVLATINWNRKPDLPSKIVPVFACIASPLIVQCSDVPLFAGILTCAAYRMGRKH